jgi:hypothetical protein
MPFGNNLMGLVIVSLGILGVIISFLITDRKKYLTALALAALVIVTGLYQHLKVVSQQWRMNRRIEELSRRSTMNLDALRPPATTPATGTDSKKK